MTILLPFVCSSALFFVALFFFEKKIESLYSIPCSKCIIESFRLRAFFLNASSN